MKNQIDFKNLAQNLINMATTLVPEWLPGGALKGNEYCCGDLKGSHGNSCRVNLSTGLWSDFATGESGGDLISLYAAINGMRQIEAAKHLGSEFSSAPPPAVVKQSALAAYTFTLPPAEAPVKSELARAKLKWLYYTIDNKLVGGVIRWADKDGAKQFSPWFYSNEKGWVKRAWPSNRYLYNLQNLKQGKPILIVEGEKSADAAMAIVGSHYSVISWQGGGNAIHKTDWAPIYGRDVLIWPDADGPGKKTAGLIANLLLPHSKSVKILSVTEKSEGWDAADALAEGWDWAKFLAWGKPIAEVITQKIEIQKSNVLPIRDNVRNAEVVTIDHDFAMWDKLGIKFRLKTGTPICNLHSLRNAMAKLELTNNKIWWDEFSYRILTTYQDEKEREWTDNDDLELTRFFQGHIGLDSVKTSSVTEAVNSFARANKRHGPRDWMEKLKWDGKKRVVHCFTRKFNAKGNDYTRLVSSNFWVGMIARCYKPGCKLDNMVVFQGPQGALKSTALEVIASEDWFLDTSDKPDSKDFFLKTQGKMIVEIAELASFIDTDIRAEKSILSTRVDKFRPPYGRRTETFPRQFVFAATTNDESYLKDPTGNRRYWPITTFDIDIKGLKQDRDQLFAEAVHMFKAGTSWWEMPSELVAVEHDLRMESDPWENAILRYLEIRHEVYIDLIAKEALMIDVERQNTKTSRRIGAILAIHGWKSSLKKSNGVVRRIYRKV